MLRRTVSVCGAGGCPTTTGTGGRGGATGGGGGSSAQAAREAIEARTSKGRRMGRDDSPNHSGDDRKRRRECGHSGGQGRRLVVPFARQRTDGRPARVADDDHAPR